MVNQIQYQGRLVHDPVSYTQGSMVYMPLRIGCKRDWAMRDNGTVIQNLQGYNVHGEDFVTGTVLNEDLMMYITKNGYKGQLVLCTGFFRSMSRDWTIWEITHYYCCERKR